MRIGVVAPSAPMTREAAEMVTALAAAQFPQVEVVFHPQCFLTHNHFAGAEEKRTEAFLQVANDPAFDALWFARGGYGSCRIAQDVLAGLSDRARDKIYLGYSDAGYLLAGLYAAGFPRLVHGPLANDIKRDGGEAAVARALSWLATGDESSLEPNLLDEKNVAFNITVFSQLIGTPLQPDLSGHILMLEDVSEHMYRTDRSMFHITSNPSVQAVAGIRLGRCVDILPNDPDFGETEEEVVRYWCGKSGINYVGRADIGHDIDNKIVPFGELRTFLG